MEEEKREFSLDKEELAMKKQLEGMVDTYDSYMQKITLGRDELLRERTIQKSEIKEGDTVLEVGSGTGTLSLAAKRKAGKSGNVYGIDIIPGMIELSKQKAKNVDEDITFTLGNIVEIPHEDNKFDVVMCSFMIFHVSEQTRRKGISEIYRVLKPGGRLFIVDLGLPKGSFQRTIAKLMLGFMINHELDELEPLFTQNRIINVESGKIDFNVYGLQIVSYISGVAQK
jgi:ubiquinone/menaquinone biosynthesis C-methylase UbiE